MFSLLMFAILFGSILIFDYFMLLKIKQLKGGIPYELKKEIQKGIDSSFDNTNINNNIN